MLIRPTPTAHDQFDVKDEKSDVQNSISTKGEELNAELAKGFNKKWSKCTHSVEDLSATVRIEMALFENGRDRGRYLSHDYFLTIAQTSVEPE